MTVTHCVPRATLAKFRAISTPFHRAITSSESGKPAVVTPAMHTMGTSLLRYLAMKVHPLVDSTPWRRLVVVGAHDRGDASVVGREKMDKPFNWMRPTAKRVGENLHIQCFPGVDHVEHYGALLTAYLRLTRKDGEWERVETRPVAEGDTIQALRAQTNILALPRADVIVTGLVHRLDSLTPGASYVGAKNDEFAWTSRVVQGKTVVFLGCRFSFWGSISGDLVRVLAQHAQPSQVIYFGKLGSTQPSVQPNRWLASGDCSCVDGATVRWNNILLSSIHRVGGPVILGKHETLGSVLSETHAWLRDATRHGYDFVDPEVGQMGRAAIETGLGFGYIHLISDNVARKYPEDLSNEREMGVLVGRDALYARVNRILGDHLESL